MKKIRRGENLVWEDPSSHQVWKGKVIQVVDEPSFVIELDDGSRKIVPQTNTRAESGDLTLQSVGGVTRGSIWEDKVAPGRTIRVLGMQNAYVWRTIDGKRRHVLSSVDYDIRFEVLTVKGGNPPKHGTQNWVYELPQFLKKFRPYEEKTND